MSGSGGVTVSSGVTAGGQVIYSGAAKSYSGDTTVSAGGVLFVTGSNLLPDDVTDGDLIVDGRARILGTQTTQGLSGSGTVDSGIGSSTLVLQGDQGATNNSFAGLLDDGTGTLSLRKTGGTTQTLTSANTYSGGTTVSGGTLQLSGASATAGTAGIGIDGTGTLELNNADVSNAITLTGRAAGTPHIDNVAGDNTASGGIALSGPGSVEIDVSADSLTIDSGNITDSGDDAQTLVLNAAAGAEGTVASDILLGSGTASDEIQKTGAGEWTIGTATTDTVDVDEGTLTLDGTLSASGTVNVDGTLDLAGNSTTITALDGGSSGVVDNSGGPATLTLGNTAPTNGSFGGDITDTGAALSITKEGDNNQAVGEIDIDGTIDVTGGDLTALTATADDVTLTTGGNFAVAGAATLGDVAVNDAASIAAFNASGVAITAVESLTNSGTVSVGGGPLNVGAAITNNLGGSITSGANVHASGKITNAGIMSVGGALSSNDDLSSSNNLTASEVTVFGGVTLSGGTNEIGDLSVTGALSVTGGSTTLTGPSSNNVGAASLTGGELTIQDASALGGAATSVDGGLLKLDGNGTDMTIDEVITLFGQVSPGAQIENVANANTIQKMVLDEGGASENYSITSSAGTLTIGNVDATGLSADGDTLNLGGDSTDGTNALTLSGSVSNLTKTGDSTWEVTDLSSGGGTIDSQKGVLALAGNATLGGSLTVDVMAGAELDVTAVTGPTAGTLDVGSGQTLIGGGLVTGNVIAASGAIIDVGDMGTAGEDLQIGDLDLDTGDLDLAGELVLNVSGSLIDELLVGGELSLTDATLDLVGALTASVYVFAEYGSLAAGSKFVTTVAGYTFDYMYGAGNNQIALVKDTPIPAPAPLALIGIGALWLGARGRRQSAKNSDR